MSPSDMYFSTGLFMLLIPLVKCINREKYQTFPPPQRNFDIHRYLGNWYYAMKLPSCSFAGAADFTNSVVQYSLQTDGVVIQNVTYRSIACTNLELTKTPQEFPGVYETKDPIGNPVSGTSIIIATDYERFAIIWSCKKTVGEICQDVALSVISRRKDPDIQTWIIVEAILRYFFEMRLKDMIRNIHDEHDLAAAMGKPSISSMGDQNVVSTALFKL